MPAKLEDPLWQLHAEDFSKLCLAYMVVKSDEENMSHGGYNLLVVVMIPDQGKQPEERPSISMGSGERSLDDVGMLTFVESKLSLAASHARSCKHEWGAGRDERLQPAVEQLAETIKARCDQYKRHYAVIFLRSDYCGVAYLDAKPIRPEDNLALLLGIVRSILIGEEVAPERRAALDRLKAPSW